MDTVISFVRGFNLYNVINKYIIYYLDLRVCILYSLPQFSLC